MSISLLLVRLAGRLSIALSPSVANPLGNVSIKFTHELFSPQRVSYVKSTQRFSKGVSAPKADANISTGLMSLRTNLSPFTKDCREFEIIKCDFHNFCAASGRKQHPTK